ncbi:hypothetical protein KDK77_06585 [bacterium]|nr:hypothetical protein [bacterium]
MAYQFFQNFDFSGGLNIRHQTAEIFPNECIVSQNWISNGRAIEVLPGYTKYNEAPIPGSILNPINSLFRFVKPSEPSVKRFLAQSGNGVWVANEVQKTWNLLIGGLYADSSMEFVTHGDQYCYMVNGYDGLKKYNGTAVSTVSNAPNGVTITGHYNRLMIAGGPEYPGRIYWSNPGAPDEWDVVNQFQEIPSTQGDPITKILFFLDGTIIFKGYSIWRIQSNFEPFPVFNISDEIGCPAKKSVVVYGDKIFWFGSTGHIYCYDRASIRNLTAEKIGALPVAANRRADVCCSIVDGRLWVSYCTENSNESFNNTLMICDITFLDSPRWFGPHKGFHINCFSSFKESEDVFFGDANTSTVWRKGTNYYFGKNFNGTTTAGSAASLTVSTAGTSIAENELAGCVIELIGGSGQGQRKIITANTPFDAQGEVLTGTIIVSEEWNPVPTEDTVWEIGAIDARYRTGILSFQMPERQKLFDKVFLHAESAGAHYLTIEVIKNHLDYGNQYFYSLLGTATIWDTAIWDESDFSSPDMLDNYVDLDYENAKYLNLEFSLKGRGLPAFLYGYILMFQIDDLLNFDGT